MSESKNDTATIQMLAEETNKYLESHPELADRLRKVQKVYRIFGDYLSMTQTRIIIRESATSSAEGNLIATLSRVDI